MSKDILRSMEERLKWLETPEGKKYSIDYINEIQKKKKDLINYVGSEEFNKIYQIIYDWVKVNGRIDDTDIHYKFNPGIELETDEWNKFTDSISEMYQDKKIIDEESSFPKYHYEFKSLDIYFMHGQGTVCWVNYNKQNDREEKLNKIL